MASFTAQVGKENVEVKTLIGETLCVRYQGKEVFVQYANDGSKVTWTEQRRTLDDKTVQLIGKAIEKYLKSK